MGVFCLPLVAGAARADSSGLDSTFGTGGKAVTNILGGNAGAYAMALQRDGKIVLAGSVQQLNAGKAVVVVRYNPDGSLDRGFGSDGITVQPRMDADVRGVALQSDGKIVVAGSASFDVRRDFLLGRFNTDGSLDASFGSSGFAEIIAGGSDFGRAVAIQSDGKILVAGYRGSYVQAPSSDSKLVVARYSSSGVLDTTFGAGGKLTLETAGSAAGSILLQPDGKVLVGGSTGWKFSVWRLLSNGAVDGAFGSGGRVEANTLGGEAKALARQPDGKIVVAGWAFNSSLSYQAWFYLVRLNANGALDTSFGNGGTNKELPAG
jgi:uncharacterized delta-60 repeat protein